MIANSASRAPKSARPSTTTTVVTETQAGGSTKTQVAEAIIFKALGLLATADKKPKPTKKELKFECNIYTKGDINDPTAGCMKVTDAKVDICSIRFSVKWSSQSREPCKAIRDALIKTGSGSVSINDVTCYPGYMMAESASTETQLRSRTIAHGIRTAFKHATDVACVARDPKSWDREREEYNLQYRANM